MKPLRRLLPLLIPVLPVAAGSFINLNFEVSRPLSPEPGDPWGRSSLSTAMPGWTAYTGDQPETAASINNIFLNTAGISLFTTRVAGPLDFSSQILQGSQSAFLQAGVSPQGVSIVPTTLAQTGTVPLGSLSLQFEAISGPAPFTVSLNGVTAPLFELGQTDRGTAPASKTFGVDLSSYAGKELDLRFTILPGTSQNGSLVLDGIQFSTAAVPEPSTWALLGLGAAALGLHRRNQRVS